MEEEEKETSGKAILCLKVHLLCYFFTYFDLLLEWKNTCLLESVFHHRRACSLRSGFQTCPWGRRDHKSFRNQVSGWQCQLTLLGSVLNARYWAKGLTWFPPMRLSWRPFKTSTIIVLVWQLRELRLEEMGYLLEAIPLEKMQRWV